MYYVYVLKSLVKERVYVGQSDNAYERVRDHNRGKVSSTKGYRPWKLVCIIGKFVSRADARRIECKLQGGFGKEFLKSILPRW